MSLFYRFFFLALVVVAGTLWWRSKAGAERHRNQVIAMADILDPEHFRPNSPQAVVGRQYFRALTMLRDYRILRNNGRVSAPDAEFLDEALEAGGLTNTEEIRLIARGLIDNLRECERLRLFDDPAAVRKLYEEGESGIPSGGFSGDRLGIGRRLPAELAAAVWNHPANFVVMPSSAAAMLWPFTVNDAVLRAAVELKAARLISEPAWQEIKSRYDAALEAR